VVTPYRILSLLGWACRSIYCLAQDKTCTPICRIPVIWTCLRRHYCTRPAHDMSSRQTVSCVTELASQLRQKNNLEPDLSHTQVANSVCPWASLQQSKYFCSHFTVNISLIGLCSLYNSKKYSTIAQETLRSPINDRIL
jgi:hypothetical protein